MPLLSSLEPLSLARPLFGPMRLDTLDLWENHTARQLYVQDPHTVPYKQVKATKFKRNRPNITHNTLLLTCKKLDEPQILVEQTTEITTRKDVNVKGAMEWEKNAWKVWDIQKKKETERRNKYGRAITHYIGGSKIVLREEPPALSQCAHCDIGGGIHPLRRCMGCFAVAYCCRLHQKAHWQWHKHICFAIRAANNLEAKKGEGAGWVKLRPRRWRRPPIEKGAVVETNCRMRWANWKQFYTNGAQPMLNMMGDGGPLVCKAWDEAIASMAMCEEATFVFGVKEVQRMMMPFVAARKAPLGTVLVVEVGVIDVRRDNGKRREVDDYLWAKNKAEKLQMKADRLEEQKFMRLRERRERAERADTVQRLLKVTSESEQGLVGNSFKASEDTSASDVRDALAESRDEVEEWQDLPEVDYEAFEDSDQESIDDQALNDAKQVGGAWVPPHDDGEYEPLNVRANAHHEQGETKCLASETDLVQGLSVARIGEPLRAVEETAAQQPYAPTAVGWESIDSLQTLDPRALERKLVDDALPCPSRSSRGEAVEDSDVKEMLECAGLEVLWPSLYAAGITCVRDLRQADSAAFHARLTAAGLKLGQRQRVKNALAVWGVN